jgi:hypothetical protein
MSANQEGIVLAGDLSFNRLVAGVYQGEFEMNGVKVEIKANSEDILVEGRGRETDGQILAAAVRQKPADLTVSFGKRSPAALAIGLAGTASDFAQGSGSATSETIVALLDGWVELTDTGVHVRNIASAGLTITNAGATVTYVLNTDYKIDYVTGRLMALSTGAITAGQSLRANFTYGAISAAQIDGMTSPNIRGKLRLSGTNLFDGLPFELEIDDATMAADSAVDWMSPKPVEITMKGRMVTVAGQTSPYRVIYGMVMS